MFFIPKKVGSGVEWGSNLTSQNAEKCISQKRERCQRHAITMADSPLFSACFMSKKHFTVSYLNCLWRYGLCKQRRRYTHCTVVRSYARLSQRKDKTEPALVLLPLPKSLILPVSFPLAVKELTHATESKKSMSVWRKIVHMPIRYALARPAKRKFVLPSCHACSQQGVCSRAATVMTVHFFVFRLVGLALLCTNVQINKHSQRCSS